MKRALRGVLLDIDGTLLDSNDAHARAWIDAFREFGFDEITFERVRPLIGMGGDKLIPEVTGLEHDNGEGKKLGTRRGEIFRERYFPSLKPFPRTRDLILRMKEDDLTLVVATSAKEKEMKKLLFAAGVEDLMEDTTSSSDAEHSKPDPDIVEVALKRSGHPPEAVIMLGDTPYDIEAATRAGVRAIALRCGGWGDADLRGATAIYDDPADLLANYESSPLSPL